MDQLTSGMRGTLRHRSRAPFAARPPARRPASVVRLSAGRPAAVLVPRTRRDVFIGTPQIDRCVRKWRFNVNAPWHVPSLPLRSIWPPAIHHVYILIAVQPLRRVPYTYTTSYPSTIANCVLITVAWSRFYNNCHLFIFYFLYRLRISRNSTMTR